MLLVVREVEAKTSCRTTLLSTCIWKLIKFFLFFCRDQVVFLSERGCFVCPRNHSFYMIVYSTGYVLKMFCLANVTNLTLSPLQQTWSFLPSQSFWSNCHKRLRLLEYCARALCMPVYLESGVKERIFLVCKFSIFSQCLPRGHFCICQSYLVACIGCLPLVFFLSSFTLLQICFSFWYAAAGVKERRIKPAIEMYTTRGTGIVLTGHWRRGGDSVRWDPCSRPPTSKTSGTHFFG